MLVNCPTCYSKARIAASSELSENTRDIYCQCLNINCSVTFMCMLSVTKIIKKPEGGSSPPTVQPDLMKHPDQDDLFKGLGSQSPE